MKKSIEPNERLVKKEVRFLNVVHYPESRQSPQRYAELFAIGEITNRVSALVLDDRAHGFSRFLRELAGDSSGIIAGNTRVNDIGLSMLEACLMQMDVGPLFGLFLQSFFIGITMRILSIIIFVIVYGRMIEIYCMVSLAPIPMATFGNHEQSHMGQNYLKCLFALGFQGFLILICVAIYAVLIQSVAISGDAINSIWSIVGYTVLLCFSLFKTSSVTKSVLGAH